MCGFVGTFSRVASASRANYLTSAMSAIAHRGPDAEGFLRESIGDGFLNVGFKRLSILDRSALADQPQSSVDGRFEMVFNGEIYNYIELRKELMNLGFTFRTDGDTEVLLSAWQAWGQAALQKLVGMFSFVVLDRQSNELVCVRDPFGIKPFFYSSSHSDFAFASEIEAIRRISSERFSPNQKVCQQYLISGNYDRGQETFFEGIYSLKPGHMMRFDCTEAHQETEQIKWTANDDPQVSNYSFEESVEILREEFLQSVRLHLRSDVKIATALSGGLDSSALVGAIRHLEPDLEIDTFSYISQSARIDESPWINEMNRAFKGNSHFVMIDKQQFYRDLDDLILCQGEPFGSTSIYAQYRVFQEARSAGVTVMLDGQGADELFAGYFGFPENRLRSLFETYQFNEAISLLSEWSKFPDRVFSQPLKSYLKDSRFFQMVGYRKMQHSVPDFFLGEHGYFPDRHNLARDKRWRGRRLAQRLNFEQGSGLLPTLLRHADRNSMRWSIESRVPFLSPALSEISKRVPEQFLLSQQGVTKYLLREALRGLVPDSIIDRKDKIGFETPQSDWLSEILKSKRDVLDGIEDVGFLDAPKTRNFLLTNSLDPNFDSHLMWRTFNLIRWNQLTFSS